MIRSFRFLLVLCFLASALAACQKKEAPPAPAATPSIPMMPSQGMGEGGTSATPEMPGGMSRESVSMPPADSMQIIVPDMVKGKWKGVTLTVVDRQNSSVKDYTAVLGGKLPIPQSDIVVQVTDFLPDFKIQGTVFTSATNQPQNPAAKVLITEKGQEVFKGWLFQKFPTMHPFQHQRYSITLKEGVPS